MIRTVDAKAVDSAKALPDRSILVFSKIPIAPSHGGNRQRIRTLLGELRRDHAVTFALIPSRQRRDCDAQGHRDFFGPGRYRPLTRGIVAETMFNAAALARRVRTKVFGDRRSTDVDYLFDRSIRAQCQRLIAALRPDIVLVEYVHFSKIFEWVPDDTLKVLDTHDSFVAEFTPAAERKGLARADTILAIQDREAALFDTLLAGAASTRVATVSHIVAPCAPIDLSRCDGASFIGSNFIANNQSLARLIDDVMPLVLARRPAFKLHVIGSVGDAIPDYPFVVKHGRVDRIADALVQAPVLANYITAGTGIKIKLLDAMNMGVPCVSTVLGAEGVERGFAAGVQITDDRQDFADALVALADDAARREVMGRAGIAAIARWNARQRAALAEAFALPGRPVVEERAAIPDGVAA
ncbi:glycosyltransferase [Sphingomonas sp.]|jgi:glycosyltransferase involved in cell wall biosynthesis|uniref:glycosyltransferase n=1 Tax=Sphingomonas sp. TaxID=28214 RepID=UPI0035C81A14